MLMTATGVFRPAPRGHFVARHLRVAQAMACGLVVFGALALADLPARAQQPKPPTPSALAVAKELIEVKGATHMFDPVIPGVIETAKNTYLKTSPQLSKDLNEVAAQLRTEYASKRADLATQVATIYAEHFTEPELKQALAFYKTPLGKKLIVEEAQVLEQSMSTVQTWADKFADEMLARFRVEMRKRGHAI
jgi:hypothetical protein